MRRVMLALAVASWAGISVAAQSTQTSSNVPTPADVKPGSITCEDVPYPQPVAYLSFKMYGQDVRMAYMDVAPAGLPNGRTVAGGVLEGRPARELIEHTQTIPP